MPVKHERVDPLGAQDHVQVGAGEGADPVLDDDDVALLRTQRGRDVGAGRRVDEAAGLGERGEAALRGLSLGIAGAEADDVRRRLAVRRRAAAAPAGGARDSAGAASPNIATISV